MFKDGQIIKSIPLYDGPPLSLNHQERVLLRKRQHWFILLLSIFITSFLSLLFISFDLLFFGEIMPNIYLMTASALIIFLIITSVIAKLTVDWYCHFYLLTTHRILEVCYKPLFSNHINNVILNQVKSTEIDIDKTGLINQLLDMGNVTVTFDRPTHQEEFWLVNIKDPRSVGFLLADVLDLGKTELDLMERPIWYKTKNEDHPFRITDEIFPKQTLGVV